MATMMNGYTEQIDSSLMASKMNSCTEGHARQNTSLSTQQTDCGLRDVKTYGNTESHAGRKKKKREILGKQRTTTLKVITKKIPQHAVGRPCSEGCEYG